MESYDDLTITNDLKLITHAGTALRSTRNIQKTREVLYICNRKALKRSKILLMPITNHLINK